MGELQGEGVWLINALTLAVLESECVLDNDAVAQCEALAQELTEAQEDSEGVSVASVAEITAVVLCDAGGEMPVWALEEELEDTSNDGRAEGESQGVGVRLPDTLMQPVLESECVLDSDAVTQCEALAHELMEAQEDSEGDKVDSVAELAAVAQCEAESEKMLLEDECDDGIATSESQGEGVGLPDTLMQAVLESECALDCDAVAQCEALVQELTEAQEDADGERVTENVAQGEAVALARALALTWLADTVAEGRLLGDADKETESVPLDEGEGE